MDKLTTALLTGAAMTALSVAPAMAGSTHQHQHALIPVGQHPGLAMIVKGVAHYKTPTSKPGEVDYTFTYSTTFNFSGARSTMLEQVKDLGPGVLWYSYSSACGSTACTYHFFDSPKQKWKAKDPNAKIKAFSSFLVTQFHFTTTYGFKYNYYTTFTYRGPAYELENASISSDNFVWHDNVKFTTSYTTSVKHKLKKTKYDYTANMKHHVAIH
jgi:hypothetical protein